MHAPDHPRKSTDKPSDGLRGQGNLRHQHDRLTTQSSRFPRLPSDKSQFFRSRSRHAANKVARVFHLLLPGSPPGSHSKPLIGQRSVLEAHWRRIPSLPMGPAKPRSRPTAPDRALPGLAGPPGCLHSPHTTRQHRLPPGSRISTRSMACRRCRAALPARARLGISASACSGELARLGSTHSFRLDGWCGQYGLGASIAPG